MELKIEELPTANTAAPLCDNYWSGSKTTSDTTKTTKKVTFNDILGSLNMVVNKGVLQFAQPEKKAEPIPSRSDGNSYIHNKYFKDYVDPNSAPVVVRQMTKAEYLKQLYNRQQIAKAKSKKLLFNTQNIAISHSPNFHGLNKMFTVPYRK